MEGITHKVLADRPMFYLENSITDDSELIGPPLLENVQMSDYSRLNLRFYLAKYRGRQYNLRSIGDINDALIAVAPNLYYNTVIYDSLEYSNRISEKPGACITALIPVDANADKEDAEQLTVFRR